MLVLRSILRNLPLLMGLTLAIAVVLALVRLSTENATLKTQNALLSRSVASLEQQLVQSRHAEAFEAERAEEFRLRSEQLTGHIETLLKGGIPDAPLDPALIELLGSLRAR